MASEDGGGGDDFGGSLFEGMVLFSPSDLSPTQTQTQTQTPPPPPSPSPPPPPPISSPLPSPSLPSPSLPSPSQPLDEDLFSDLTLQPNAQVEEAQDHQHQPPSLSPLTPPQLRQLPRQISRKKKRAVRIGYARDSAALPDEPPPTSIAPTPRSPEPPPPSPPLQIRTDPPLELPDRSTEDAADGTSRDDDDEEEEIAPSVASSEKDDSFASIEERLELVRAKIAGKLERIRETASSVAAERKWLERRRRKAVEEVNLASLRFRELEKELEEACEAEDFERAERVSESLAAAEKEKDGLVSALKDMEMECDAVDLRMQEVLESQIAADEEGAALLEQFAKDAAEHAVSVLENAEEIFSKRLQEWQSSIELLEVSKMEVDIESHIISEVHSGLEHSIEHLVEDDKKEVEILKRKRGTLAKELDELLALVRLKEAEIAENDSQIHEVKRKIADVVSEFRETQSNVDMRHDNLQLVLSKIESEGEALSAQKNEIDEFMLIAEQKSSKLKELASITLDEARTCQNSVGLRKSLASSILKSREDKVQLAKTEERISEEIQILRQQISAARTSLQELSSSRASMQQEIASLKQRIGFIDKRGPELEAEKKVAASARNFKEAGRIAAEAKALNVERESLQNKKEKAVLDLNKLEEGIKDTVDKIQESEGLILLKEKEAAMAGCKRLRLVAAAARAERSATLEMGDSEEGGILLKEAEAAESKARELQEAYNLELEENEKTPEQHFASIAFITPLQERT